MKHPSPFDKLCSLCGVEAGYEDIWGEYRTASRKTRRALLQAMGVDVRDEAAVEASLHQWENAQWERLLPPVQVVALSSEPLHVPLQWPGQTS